MNEELRQAQQRQLHRLAHLESQGERVGGWKLGQTSGESRDAFGRDVRPFGFILASRILAEGDSLSWGAVETGGIESEICFVIDSDITAEVSASTVRHHLAGIAPAFEINQRRIEKTSPAADRIEDGLANQLLEHGRFLKAGDRTITGAFGKQNQPAPGIWHGQFGPDLGQVALLIEP